MSTWIKVARFHLADRMTFLFAPIIILALTLAVALAIASAVSGGNPNSPTAGPVVFYFFFFALGLISARSLAFGLSLGISRRAYYAGTVLLALALTASFGLLFAVLQVIERATNGWGVDLTLFRVPFILEGPWYVTWLTVFVGLTLMFVFGLWYGIVFRRWGMIGLVTFGLAQLAVLLAAVLVISHLHAWASFGHFVVSLSALGVTGVLAGLALILLGGGYATVRHVAV